MNPLFPWENVQRGQGFFVPALDVDAVREAGLLAALKLHITDAVAFRGIVKGRLGVYFCRRPISPKLKGLS
jgi:hypothetical protein